MHAVAHEARLNQPSNPKEAKSPTHRAVYRALAAKGDVRAQAALEEPRYPASLDYLRAWSRALFGRSGLGMEGVSPLKPTEVLAWAQLSGHDVTPMEFDALLLLDAVRRDPSMLDTKTETRDEPTTPKTPASERWPKRKSAGRMA
ncbi:hypothetical protein [Gemmatimonas sp.]|uniref:hypothetical protein n=1 Tax=Gemmatimonas sp. TaxID=1962908 RepID=UPI003342BC93